MSRASLAVWALLLAALPLGTAPGEIAAGLACGLALLALARRQGALDPALAWPVALVAVSWLVSALGREPEGAHLLEALGRTWPLCLALLLPALPLAPASRPLVERVGLFMACGAALIAVAQGVQRGVPPWDTPNAALFSHHLTLGYALLPALAATAVDRRWGATALLLLGVAATGSSGPVLAVAVIGAGLWLGPGRALVAGSIAAVGLVAALQHTPSLGERSVLWTSGATLALEHPLGVGPAGYRAAVAPVQATLAPDFYFPQHAHDAALQLAALAGFGGWVAWGWLLLALWRRADTAGRLALAGLLVGGLTQDTLGDLEVIRALSAWTLLRAPAPGTSDEA